MKKSYFFKFFVFALVGALAILPSCKDYDDDISRLDTDLTAAQNSLTSAVAELNTLKTQIDAAASDSDVSTAVNTAKTEAIATAKTDATNLLNELRGGYTGTMEEINDEIIDLAALITVLQGDVSAIGTDLDAVKLEVAANKAAIELQKSILDKYLLVAGDDNIIDAIAAIQEELAKAATKADLDATKADLDATKANLDAVSERIDAIDGKLNILDFAKINNMITEVSFDYLGDDYDYRDNGDFDLNFTTTSAQIDHVFATGVTNAVTFVKGQRVATEGVTIMVKVSPANADLSKMLDKIKLIRSDANAEINNFVVATKAERAKPMLTRATPTVTGLWNITFNLPISANLTELGKLVNAAAPATSNLFALAIENTVDEAEDAEDRFVISDFAIAITAGPVTPVYNLTFDAKNSTDAAWTAHTAIRNRYGVTDPVSGTALTDKVWNPTPWVTTSTAVADVSDNRNAPTFDLLNVEVAKEFNVRLSPTPNNVYGYYVTLDKDYAIESIPSELNAWNAYESSIEGLNTLYKADEVAKLKINAAAAAGDIIGFRVVAVNWDGTLVDPDGKAFYVGVGASASSTLAFKQIITAPVITGASVDSDILTFAPPAGVAVSSAEFSMALEHGQTLTTTDFTQFDAATGVSTTTNWALTKRLQINNAIPANLKENTAYSGTLTLKNAAGIPVFVQNITLTKVLPSADLGITYKTNIHHDVAGQQVVYGYPLPGTGYYDVTTALQVPTGMNNLVVTNESDYPAASLPTWNIASTPGLTAANIPTAEIGVPYLPAVAPGHGKIYDLTLSRNYGPVKYSATVPAGVDYLLNWNGTPALKVEFRSFIQDLYDWEFATSGTPAVLQTPTLVYGVAPAAYSLKNITALPPAGPRIDMTNTSPSLQDSRDFTIVSVELLTGANFDVVNEYFTPTVGGGNITFAPVTTSTPAGPVPTKLKITLKDDFGHDYEFVVPQSFNMTLN
jgi:hypothetical protein